MTRTIKILVISSNPFSKHLNNGKTLETIFSAFPPENLSQLFFRTDIPDFDYCQNYYRVTDYDIINRLFGKTKKCGGKIINSKKNNIISKPSKKAKFSYFWKIKNKIRLIRDILWSTQLWKNNDLKKWSEETGADLIFFVAGSNGCFHQIARYLTGYLGIPMVVFFTDDYLIYPRYKHILNKIQRIRMKAFYKRTIDRSAMRFCIGELMAEEYTKYFNKDFHYVMNAIEIRPFVKKSDNKDMIFSYFGGLHLDRWKMISRFAKCIEQFGTLHVHTSSEITKEIEDSFNEHKVKLLDFVVGEDLVTAMQNSDVLLHVESDMVENRSFTKLAISTKIPEYLGTGRLVIGFGPPEVASMRLLSDNRIGYVISSDLSDKEITDKLNEIFSDKKQYGKIEAKAYEYAVKNYNKCIIAENVKEQLINLKQGFGHERI